MDKLTLTCQIGIQFVISLGDIRKELERNNFYFVQKKKRFSIHSNTLQWDRDTKEEKLRNYSTFDWKIDMIYFVLLAQWWNGSTTIGSNLGGIKF